MTTRIITTAAVLLAAAAVQAQSPRMGGPMSHIMIGLDGDAVLAMNPHTEPRALRDYGESYPGPASVLDGTAYNAQYGWMAMAGLSLPADTELWIELLDATPGLAAYEALSFAPIHGTDGSPMGFAWDGRMLHNWWAATRPGSYEATFEVSLRLSDGTPVGGVDAARTTLRWIYRPDCAADLDGDGGLTFFDFLAFQTLFDAGDPVADMDGDGELGLFDFLAFQNAFDAGC